MTDLKKNPKLLIQKNLSYAIPYNDIITCFSSLAIRQKLLYRNLRESSRNLDLAFLVDCTGSMAPYIKHTKLHINNILLALEKEFTEVIILSLMKLYSSCAQRGSSE